MRHDSARVAELTQVRQGRRHLLVARRPGEGQEDRSPDPRLRILPRLRGHPRGEPVGLPALCRALYNANEFVSVR